MKRIRQNVGTSPTPASEEAQERMDDIKSLIAIRKDKAKMKTDTKKFLNEEDILKEINRLRKKSEGRC